MSYRSFVDPNGLRWQVWTVIPSPQGMWAGRGASAPPAGDHAVPEAPTVRLAMRQGWLAFQAGADHRRVMGIPDGWEDRSDDGLVQLLGRAEQVTHRGTRRA